MKSLIKIKKIKLSNQEKGQIYDRIMLAVGETRLPVKSPYVFLGFFNQSHFRYVAAVFLVCILTGGTAMASKNALPGDILYPIKIKVLEKVPDILAFTSEAKAKRNAKKLEARMREYEVLAEQGRLDKKKAVVINATVEEELEKFDKNVEQTKKEEKEEVTKKINDDFNTKVKEHKGKIKQLQEDKGAESVPAIDKIIEREENRKNNDHEKEVEEKNNFKEDHQNNKNGEKEERGPKLPDHIEKETKQKIDRAI